MTSYDALYRWIYRIAQLQKLNQAKYFLEHEERILIVRYFLEKIVKIIL